MIRLRTLLVSLMMALCVGFIGAATAGDARVWVTEPGQDERDKASVEGAPRDDQSKREAEAPDPAARAQQKPNSTLR